MLRSFLPLALSMFLLAEASAQTAPAVAPKKAAKTAKATARTAARNAKKTKRLAAKAATPLNDGWPPLDDSKTALASAATADANGWPDASPAIASRGEIDNANVYAAPGMPVHLRTNNAPVPYSVRPPRKPAGQQTTLGN